MYSIDGVPLQNPGLGWRLKRPSEPWLSRSFERPDFNAANRDGTVSVRGHQSTPTVSLVVHAPGSTIEALRRLLRLGTTLTLTSDGSVVLKIEALTVTHRTVTPAGAGLYEITVVYRCPEVWWRDYATTDYSATLQPTSAPGAANLAVVTRSTAPVHDAIVVVQGAVENCRLAGQNYSWMQLTGVVPGGWIRFDSTRGRAWTGATGTDPWSNTANEATSLVNTGALPYFLELTPASTGAPGAVLTVSFNRILVNPATVTVRARNAYDR